MPHLFRVLVFTFALALATPAAFAADYFVTNLGTISGFEHETFPRAINNSGQVAGYVTSGPGVNRTTRAFLYSGGVIQNLGTLEDGGNSYASDINEAGVVAGYASQAFIYSGGVMQPIGALAPGGASTASGINNVGQVVGDSAYPLSPGPGNTKHSFLYSGGTMTDLGYIGGSMQPTPTWGINDAGQIVGGYYPTAFNIRGFISTNGAIQEVGTLGGGDSLVTAINQLGRVVGTSQRADGTRHAFFFDGSIHDLGTIGTTSFAYGLNELGNVVGNVTLDGQQRAFIYRNGTMTDLNSLIDPASGWVLTSANDINDLGQIIGTGLFNGESRGFVLTPVPEPSTILMASLGVASLCAIRACRPRRK